MKYLALIYFSLFSVALWPFSVFNSAHAVTVPHTATATTHSIAVSVLVHTQLEGTVLQLQFTQPARWQQVLAQLQSAGLNARWAQLTKPSEQAELEAMRTRVLSDLHVLGQRWARQGKPGLLRSSVALSAQLGALPLVARQAVSMDYDQVRLNARFNPQLAGDYKLALHPRSTVVWAQGLVHLPGKRPFVGGAFAYDYGRRLSLLPGAEQQKIWIIQPDGQVMNSPVDPFSPQFVGVAPGATLYVGFADLPDEFADLDQRIMTLFTNREI